MSSIVLMTATAASRAAVAPARTRVAVSPYAAVCAALQAQSAPMFGAQGTGLSAAGAITVLAQHDTTAVRTLTPGTDVTVVTDVVGSPPREAPV